MTSRDEVNAGRDITPEHTLRHNTSVGDVQIAAADAYVKRVVPTCDYADPYPAWHGWALREAFLAGISYERAPLNALIDNAALVNKAHPEFR